MTQDTGSKNFFKNAIDAASREAVVDCGAEERIDEILYAIDEITRLDGTLTDDLHGGGVLQSALTQFYRQLDEAGVDHSFGVSEVVAWVVIEILDTGVELSEIDYWLCHEPTIHEILLSEEGGGILGLFITRKDRSNRRRFRSQLKKMGISKRKSPSKTAVGGRK